MEYIIGIIVGAFVGWKVADWLHLGSLIMILKEFKITEDQIREVLEREGELPKDSSKAAPGKNILSIKVEKHGEQLYAFELETDRFLGQGATSEDLAKKILEKVPSGLEIHCDIKNGCEYFTLEAK